jgi:protein-tyrosine phosphatase
MQWCPPSDILPRLVLGDIDATHDRAWLDARGITHVLTVLDETHWTPALSPRRTLWINAKDREDEDLAQHFARACAWIDDALATDGTVVYVHCFAGVSRSATIVAAYLCHAGVVTSAEEALAFVKARRPCVDPNDGFQRQLVAWAP